MLCLRIFSAVSFCRSANRCSEGIDCTIECIIIQIVQPLRNVGRHRHGLTEASIEYFLGCCQPDFRIRVVQRVLDDFKRFVGMFASFGGKPLRAPPWVAGLAGLKRNTDGH